MIAAVLQFHMPLVFVAVPNKPLQLMILNMVENDRTNIYILRSSFVDEASQCGDSYIPECT
jgi:hypothetical protein